MNLSELSDQALLKHVAARDTLCDTAVRELYHRYEKFLIRDSSRHVYLRGKPHLVDELVQAALQSLYTNPSAWDGTLPAGQRASLLTWLNKKVSFLLQDVIRKDSIERERFGNVQSYLSQFNFCDSDKTTVGNEFEAMSQYLAYCLNDTAPSAEHGAYIREMNLAIRACKDALSPEMQRVFTSAFENEMSHTVTAETENCPVATIRTRLHAAKKLMVSCMQRKGFEVSGSLTRGLP